MKDPPLNVASLIVLTLPQFRELLNGVLEEKLGPLLAALQSNRQQSQGEYLTTKQALAFLQLSKPTLNGLRRQQVITAYHSSDKRVLYKRSELVAYLESSKRKEAPASC